MKPLFLALVALAAGQQVFATNVSGLLSGSNTFTKANGPYIVTADMLVDEGATLYIEPGTEIKVDPGVNFYVDGSIKALGTVTDPIIFTANTANPKRGSWKGIGIRNTGVADSSVFDFCHFYYSSITATGGNLSITRCIINECMTGLGISTPGEYFVGNNIIKHCNQGLYVMGKGNVSANEIAHIDEIAIEARGYTNVVGNYIHDSKCGIFFSGGYGLVYSEIANNKVVNVEMWAYWLMTAEITSGVHNNLAAHCGIGYILNQIKCTVDKNTSIHNKVGIDIRWSSSDLVFKNNCIDSSTEYNVKIVGSYDMDISGNYWGTTDSATLHARMFDFYDDFVAPKGLILPVLLDANYCQAYTGPITTSIPGTKNESVKITVTPNPFTDRFSIELPREAAQLAVVNMSGQQVYNADVSGKTKTEVDLSSLPPGVYHYRVALTDHTTATGKLVKQ
ncbi:MAG: hypothetical protein K0R82_2254 [Flavipsychrobacter sp.]|nr:hypothetical protein [Flavipsychrobacter sp.]